MVLCARLREWFRPFREQAGAQERRGCVENIVTLRLWDMARRKKLTLFVTFIDYSTTEYLDINHFMCYEDLDVAQPCYVHLLLCIL